MVFLLFARAHTFSSSHCMIMSKVYLCGWFIRFDCKLMVSIQVRSFVISFNAWKFSTKYKKNIELICFQMLPAPRCNVAASGKKPFGRFSIHSLSRGIMYFIQKITLWFQYFKTILKFVCISFGNIGSGSWVLITRFWNAFNRKWEREKNVCVCAKVTQYSTSC